MIQFAWWWCFLLLPAPIAVRRWMPKTRSENASPRIPFLYHLAVSEAMQAAVSGKALVWVALIWAALITACARPLWIEQSVKIPVTGRDLLIALDISGSMETVDFSDARSTRFAVVQAVASDFIKRRVGDRVGLILFGSRPYLYAPLTFDVETVADFLEQAQVGFAGKRTAIGDTIALAAKVLRERPAENRILILLTDGENSAGALTPAKAAAIATEYGIRIFTVGIGPDLALQSAGSLSREFARIAEATGGRYFHASNSRKLEQIYQEIDAFEPLEADQRSFTRAHELYPWLLGLAMALFAALALSGSGPPLRGRSQVSQRRAADVQ